MGEKSGAGNSIHIETERHPNIAENARTGSIWDWECYDKNGGLKWCESVHNLVTNEGLDHYLGVTLSSVTQITSWYVVIFENDHTPAAANTYAIPGYTESSAYDEAARPAWTEAGVSSQSITNSAAKASFTINATKTIYGGALVGGGSAASTTGNTAGGGTLLCLSAFSSGKPVEDDDVIKLTITATMSAS